MLQRIRDKATGTFALLILGILILAFAVWGIDFQFGANQAFVSVDGEDVPNNLVANSFNREIRRLQEQYPGGIPDIVQEDVKQNVLEAFVRSELLEQHAKNEGYGINDSSVWTAIKETPAFQIDGKFELGMFRDTARRNGLSEDGLFNDFRKSMVLQQITSSLRDTAFITSDEVRQRGELQREKRTIKKLQLSAGNLIESVVVDDAAIDVDYELNQANYMTDEMVRIDYIELDPKSLAETVSVEESEILEIYDTKVQLGEFATEETRKSRHILLRLNDSRDDDAAQEVLNGLRERALAGEDFAALASEFSEDGGTKIDGGALDWSNKGQFVGPFSETLFAMSENEISAPVKTRFGYHIIKLEGVRGGEVRPLDEVRAELTEELKADKATGLIIDLVNEIDEVVYDIDDSLVEAAGVANVEVKQSDWFSRLGGAGVASNTSVIDQAFSPQVLQDRLNSSSIEVNDKYIYLRINEHRPARQMTIDEVRPRIESALKRKLASEEAVKQGAAALEQLQSGQTLEQIAASLEMEVGESATIERFDRTIPQDGVRAIYSAARPVDSSVYGGTELGNGDYLLFEVESVTPGEPLDDTLSSNFALATASMEFAAYLSALRDDADVVTRPSLLIQ